jgi:hypothetical protein
VVVVATGAFFKVPAFWSMIIVHFGENWGKFTLMAWMPIYYKATLGERAKAATSPASCYPS